jgi:hypothetical protein
VEVPDFAGTNRFAFSTESTVQKNYVFRPGPARGGQTPPAFFLVKARGRFCMAPSRGRAGSVPTKNGGCRPRRVSWGVGACHY